MSRKDFTTIKMPAQNNLIHKFDKINLKEINLEKINLKEINLEKINLNEINLEKINLNEVLNK